MAEKRYYFDTEETVTRQKKGYITLSNQYVQMYKSAIKPMMRLSDNCSKLFLMWVIFKVNREMKFTFNTKVVDDFNAEMLHLTGKEYYPTTVKNGVASLVRENLLEHVGHAMYRVNPKMFWNTTPRSRVLLLKKENEKSNGN